MLRLAMKTHLKVRSIHFKTNTEIGGHTRSTNMGLAPLKLLDQEERCGNSWRRSRLRRGRTSPHPAKKSQQMIEVQEHQTYRVRQRLVKASIHRALEEGGVGEVLQFQRR
jgi:hypothetical protein